MKQKIEFETKKEKKCIRIKQIIVSILCFAIILGMPEKASEINNVYTVDGSLAKIQLEFKSCCSAKNRTKEEKVTYIDNEWGTEQIIKINSEDMARFEIRYGVDGGGYISSKAADGSLLLFNNSNELVAAVDTIKVEDFWGNDVSAMCNYEDETATYVIDATSVTFPLTARIQVYGVNDFSQWFKEGHWWRNGSWTSLQLIPTDGWHGLGSSTGVLTWSWNTVYNKFSSDSRWTNTQGMSEQYQCHVLGASMKDAWNLEPARPCVGITATMAEKCNPE